MTPSEDLSTEPGVLAVAYPFPRGPLVEVVDAQRVTTVETVLSLGIEQRFPTHAQYDAALADLGYTRTERVAPATRLGLLRRDHHRRLTQAPIRASKPTRVHRTAPENGAALMSTSDRKQAIAEHKAAKQHLAEVSRRDQSETEDYLAANAQVAATEKRVPWWRR